MIHSLTVTNYLGDSLTLKLTEIDPENGIYIKEIKGLGPVKADINTTKLATSDGTVFNSSRLNQRNIVITLGYTLDQLYDIETTRQLTYKFFPIKRQVTLIFETDNRIVQCTGNVETNEPDIFSREETAKISIICSDPNFYSSGKDGTIITTFFGIEPRFMFPFSNPVNEATLMFGSIENKTENTIMYNGDADVGLIIRMHALGDVGNVAIYNTGTRELMYFDMEERLVELTGSGFSTGDTIIVSTLRSNKSVQLLRAGSYTNVLNILDKDSNWFKLVKGENTFAFTANYGERYLEFRIESKVVFDGV